MIRITDLTKRFDGKPAVDRLCATLPTGSVYGIVGSNGAGKSTLLRLTAGVYKPDGGEIALEGEPVYGNPAAKGKIAFLVPNPKNGSSPYLISFILKLALLVIC